jgi:hypothetical protein
VSLLLTCNIDLTAIGINDYCSQFAAYLKKKNASGQQGEQRKKKKIKNETDSSKEVSVAGESLDSSPLASSLEDNEVVNLVSYINYCSLFLSFFNNTVSVYLTTFSELKNSKW